MHAQMCVFPRVFDVVFLHRAGAAVCVRYADGGRRGIINTRNACQIGFLIIGFQFFHHIDWQILQTGLHITAKKLFELVILPFLAAEFSDADALDETDRGAGGFGSTGR